MFSCLAEIMFKNIFFILREKSRFAIKVRHYLFVLIKSLLFSRFDLPLFDFRLPGVSSISADTHKVHYFIINESQLTRFITPCRKAH